MITPRATRVHRVPGLRALQRAVALLACGQPPLDCLDTVVIVPTAGAAGQLRATLERLRLVDRWEPAADDLARAARTWTDAGSGFVVPHLLTLDGWYDLLYDRMSRRQPRLTPFDRDVLFREAAAAAEAAGLAPPFALRPGLVGEMIVLYDALRRRFRTVEQFERMTAETLEASAEIDRGARRLLQQTRFLAEAFRGYERRLADLGRWDEHLLRAALEQDESAAPVRQVVVTVGDQHGDPAGLWLADLTLLARLPGLERIDIVATARELAAGWHDRLQAEFPGIETVDLPCGPLPMPTLQAPPTPDGPRHFLVRDREEEVIFFAKTLKASHERAARDARPDDPERTPVVSDLERTAFVFDRPLPYLYVARAALTSAGLPFQAIDALPLAAEPLAAVFDLVTSVVLLDWTRGAVVSLLRSPFLVDGAGRRPSAGTVGAFDRALVASEFLGGRTRLAALAGSLAASHAGDDEALARLAALVAELTGRLAPLDDVQPAVRHVEVLLDFLRTSIDTRGVDAPLVDRHARAFEALAAIMTALRDSHAALGDWPVASRDVIVALRRWIESHTFNPRVGTSGPHLVDGAAARYGLFDRVHLAGLVEGEWQPGTSRSIFYPASLLQPLGWPRDTDRQLAAVARFVDLVSLATRETRVTTFALEDDTVVRGSPLVEELNDPALPVERVADPSLWTVLVDELLAADEAIDPPLDMLRAAGPLTPAWLAFRRQAATRPAPPPPAQPLLDAQSVTRLETYLQCPFRYFAAHVLRLGEEAAETIGLSPRERGIVLHEVFEEFFRRWTDAGRRAVTAETIVEARALLAAVVDDRLTRLPPEDRGIERARLLGSAAATGFGELVLRHEVDRDAAVVERLLEFALDGEYEVSAGDRARRVRLRAVADRIDLTEGDGLRLYDYKSSRAPHPRARLQLPVYALCAEQKLDGHRGRRWEVAEAGYMAVREAGGYVAVVGSTAPRARVLAEGAGRLLETLEGIEAGQFPVRPVEPFRCTFCPYPSVCRKDYVGDD